MAQTHLHYQIHPDRQGHGEIPLCEVALIGKTRRVLVSAVVDSGATHPMFPCSVAEDAGIDLSGASAVRVDFGGSNVVARRIRAYIEIIGIPDRRFNPDIIFVDDLRLGYAMLGRRGVFAE